MTANDRGTVRVATFLPLSGKENSKERRWASPFCYRTITAEDRITIIVL
jgi:hypothetical protein